MNAGRLPCRHRTLAVRPRAELRAPIGGLIAAVGVALVAGARERRPHRSLAILGAGSAFALGMADLVYGLRGRISKVYLADAVVEGGVIATWLTARK